MRQVEILEQLNQGQDVLEKMILKLNHEDRAKLKNYLQWAQGEEDSTIIDSMIELLDNTPDLTSVRDWIDQGKTIHAVKEYRALMGTDLKTSYEAVKSMTLKMGYDWENR